MFISLSGLGGSFPLYSGVLATTFHSSDGCSRDSDESFFFDFLGEGNMRTHDGGGKTVFFLPDI